MAEHAASRENTTEVEVDVVVDAEDWAFLDPLDDLVSKTTEAIAETLETREPGPFAVTVALMDDAGIAELNQNFREKSGPTNVLSFPAAPTRGGGGDGDGGATATPSPQYLGDIAMARETILKEAQELNISPGDHFCHLLAHGILHLFGYDHDTENAANEMEGLETSIMSRIGIADPYRDR